MAARGAVRQGELFGPAPILGMALAEAPPPLLRDQLLAWHERLAAHQGPLFLGQALKGDGQGDLFAATTVPAADDAIALAQSLDPLSLEAQSLSFWRWPAAPQQGAAIYLVLDRPAPLATPLLLYVGETARADRRWKGEHDCKGYLAAYSEALRGAGLEPCLSIRFWSDVPAGTGRRRALEQALIRHWLPPFNKETRDRWTTPFTADPR